MVEFAVRRILVAVLVALTVATITFSLLQLSGDLAVSLAGAGAPAEAVEAVRRDYGLDRPIVVQYLDWIRGAVQGDLGTSFFFKQPVTELIAERLPVTFKLGAASVLLALLLALPLGVLAALRPGSWYDRLALTLAVSGLALPTFWFGLLMMIYLGVELRWLPISGTGTWKHFVMPSIALAYYAMPAIMRLTRAGMLEVLSADYIRTARAKGLREFTVLFKHALRNAIIPVVALSAVQFGLILSGSVIIESVFALHGIGYLGWESISRSDFPVVQGVVLVVAVIYILLTVVADLLNASLDPRIRV